MRRGDRCGSRSVEQLLESVKRISFFRENKPLIRVASAAEFVATVVAPRLNEFAFSTRFVVAVPATAVSTATGALVTLLSSTIA